MILPITLLLFILFQGTRDPICAITASDKTLVIVSNRKVILLYFTIFVLCFSNITVLKAVEKSKISLKVNSVSS